MPLIWYFSGILQLFLMFKVIEGNTYPMPIFALWYLILGLIQVKFSDLWIILSKYLMTGFSKTLSKSRIKRKAKYSFMLSTFFSMLYISSLLPSDYFLSFSLFTIFMMIFVITAFIILDRRARYRK